MTRVGDKVFSVDDGVIWDSDVTVNAVAGTHTDRQSALDQADEIARSADFDAAVVRVETVEGETFEVVAVKELDRSAPIYGGREGLVAVKAGRGNAVGLRTTSNRSSAFDSVHLLLRNAGIGEADSQSVCRSGLSVARAQQLLTKIERQSPTYGNYGPRMALLSLLRDVVTSGAPLSASQTLQRVQAFRGICIVRPDGYMAAVLSGRPLQRMGEVRVDDQGLFRAGADTLVGVFYCNRGGVFYDTDSNLRPQGPPVTELALEHDLPGRVLDGIASGVGEMVSGLWQLVRHPIDTLVGLRQLPAAVRLLIENSPDYWERFKNMTLGDQIEEVSRLTTLVMGTYGCAAGSGARLGAAAGELGSLSIPTLSLSADGTLAYSMATVRVGTAATALSGGPGAVYVLHMASRLPSPEGVERNRAFVAEQMQQRYGAAVTRSGEVVNNISELPRALRTAPEIEAWLARNGFTLERQVGSHRQWVGPNGGRVTIAGHGNADILSGTLSNIRRQTAAALARQ